MKRFIVTTAVNQTRVHPGFWSALGHAAKHLQAELIVVGAVYKNPTVRGKRGEGDDVYAPELIPFLTRKRRVLGKNLTLFADIPVQPTAGNPTSAMEVFCKDTSAIIGHVKRAMTVVPAVSHPRVLWTTGACTRPSYSKSRAGARAREHHVLGALIVEVTGKTFFVRNVTANKDGSFTDLDATYTAAGVKQAAPALSVTAGDIHVGQEDFEALEALEGLVRTVQPKWLVLHDVLDFHARSHHGRDKRSMYDTRESTVDAELTENAGFLKQAQGWGAGKVAVVSSNHHDHLTRWLEECDPAADPLNAEAYHRLWLLALASRRVDGQWPDIYAQWMGICGVKGVRFLGRAESLRLAGVEHAFHGDKGVGGARGSIQAFAKLGSKTTLGHSHKPGVVEGCFQVGVTGRLDMGYTLGQPKTQLHAHVVLHADGRRQMVITQGRKYRGY